jgi:hypothetical protein
MSTRSRASGGFPAVAGIIVLISAALACGLLGGAQSSPESVARAYVDAIAAADCAAAESYLVPEIRDQNQAFCGDYAFCPFTSAEVESALLGEGPTAATRAVTLRGTFERESPCGTVYTLNLGVEEIDGKWYVTIFFVP